MTVSIDEVINYLQPNAFTLITLKRKMISTTSSSKLQKTTSILYNPADYGMTNVQIIQPFSNSFVAYNAATRILFTDNYVSSNPKTIKVMNDYTIPG